MPGGERIRWSQQSLEELTETYWTRIAPAMQRDGMDPDAEKPTHQWLSDHGFRGLEYALRVHHDHTLSEFFVDVVGVGEDNRPGEYDWGVSDDDVADALEEFIRSLERRREDISDKTAATKRARIAKFARIFDDLHGADALLDIASDPSKKPEAREKVLAVFDELNRELTTSDSKIRYHADISEFYDRLSSWGRVAFNPVDGIRSEYGWTRSQPDNPALSTSDVRTLYAEAETVEERLLVVGLAGWGLRTSELASLHRNQIVLEDVDDPFIEFETRKNGPGTVSIIYGLVELADQIDDLADNEDWNGYIFPSSRAESGHVSPDTVRARFQRLADRAGVRVRGDTPQPKMGRRFWYDSYLNAMDAMLKQIGEFAGDQGSASTEVVARNYLSEERRREFRRKNMRAQLEQAFGA